MMEILEQAIQAYVEYKDEYGAPKSVTMTEADFVTLALAPEEICGMPLISLPLSIAANGLFLGLPIIIDNEVKAITFSQESAPQVPIKAYWVSDV